MNHIMQADCTTNAFRSQCTTYY